MRPLTLLFMLLLLIVPAAQIGVAQAQTLGLSLSPTTLTVNLDSSGACLVTINPQTADVNLSVTGVPAGVDAKFTVDTIPAGETLSVLLIYVSPNATPGTYNLTVTATMGATTESKTLTLNIPAAPDFALSASPGSLNINQGSTGTSTITVTSLNGYTGTVNLTISGVPAGVTASFTPSSLTPPANGTATSILTLTVAANATPGTYVLTVTGTDPANGITHTAAVLLAIQQVVQDFNMAVSPSTLTLNRGESGTVNLTAFSIGTFSGSVNLTFSGVPAGVSVAAVKSSLTLTAGGSDSTAITVFAGSNATPGTYTITATGTSGNLTHTAAFSVTISAVSPDFSVSVAPNLLSIDQGASASTLITVTSLNNFAGTVNFNVLSLPTGVTASFTPSSLTPPANGSLTANLTLTVASNAPLGTYPLTVRGTSGALIHDAALGLKIPGFTLTVSPTTLTVTQNQSASATVTLTSLGSFTDTINLNVTPSTFATISPSNVNLPVDGTATATITVSPTSSTPAGNYTLTITGTGATTGKKATATLTVTVQAAPAPAPAAPAAPPAAVTPPTAEEIEQNPETAGSRLVDVVRAGLTSQAASKVEEAATEAAAKAIVKAAAIDPSAAAAILEYVSTEKAASIIETIAVTLSQPATAASIIDQMSASTAAKALDPLAAKSPASAAAILELTLPTTRAKVLAEIVKLPATPEKAAAILEEMSLEKAVEAIEYMVKLGMESEAEEVLAYLSEAKLNQIWASLSDVYRDKLALILRPETAEKLKLLFKAEAANLVILSAGETLTVAYAEKTGVDLTLTAKEDTAGIVRTGLYTVNPYPEASKPENVSLKKFIYVNYAFPKSGLAEAKLTVHYLDSEVKGLFEFSLTIYKYDADANAWKPIPTSIDKTANTATVTLEAGGAYALGGI